MCDFFSLTCVFSIFLFLTGWEFGLIPYTNMLHVKLVPTPMVSSQHLSASGSVPFCNTQLNRSTIGALKYVTITCSEITYSVNRV